jgi:hypothetical protein
MLRACGNQSQRLSAGEEAIKQEQCGGGSSSMLSRKGVELFRKNGRRSRVGKAKVCKTFHHRFESGRRLQRIQAAALLDCPVQLVNGNAGGWRISGGFHVA